MVVFSPVRVLAIAALFLGITPLALVSTAIISEDGSPGEVKKGQGVGLASSTPTKSKIVETIARTQKIRAGLKYGVNAYAKAFFFAQR